MCRQATGSLSADLVKLLTGNSRPQIERLPARTYHIQLNTFVYFHSFKSPVSESWAVGSEVVIRCARSPTNPRITILHGHAIDIHYCMREPHDPPPPSQPWRASTPTSMPTCPDRTGIMILYRSHGACWKTTKSSGRLVGLSRSHIFVNAGLTSAFRKRKIFRSVRRH